MRLYTVKKNNNNLVGYLKDGKMYKVDVKDMNELIDQYDSYSFNEDTVIEDYEVVSPIVCPKQDVICIGVNYDEHIQETKYIDQINFENKQYTVYFSKRVSKANGMNGIIPDYDFVDSLDYEAELGVVLKKDVFHASKEEAMDAILGYTIINDVSARNVQMRHQQWYLGKSLDGYTSIGPCIVTKDEIEDITNLEIECYLNDERRQYSNTKYMITPVLEAIVELSQGMTLQKGTIIATGTPGGVGLGMHPPGYMHSKDVVRCVIEGIGELVNIVE